MAIFGKPKEELQDEQVAETPVDEFVPPSELPEVEEDYVGSVPDIHSAAQTPSGRTPEESGENLAPVFVKVSKYKDILNTVNYLKMGFGVIKSQIAILSKLIKLERDNMDLLYAALEKVGGQLNKLDSDFTKPVDFMREVADMKVQDMRGLESAMEDLKTQIEKLKSEVETLA